MNTENLSAISAEATRIRGKMTVRKVSCEVLVKMPRRDFRCEMEADIEEGATIEEARRSHILLALEVGIAANRAVLAEAWITEEQFASRVQVLKKNTIAHLERLMTDDGLLTPAAEAA